MNKNKSTKLQAKVKSLPNTPGVYFFKNSKGKIIYIGKARKLSRRVSSNFNKAPNDLKTQLLVDKMQDLDCLKLDS